MIAGTSTRVPAVLDKLYELGGTITADLEGFEDGDLAVYDGAPLSDPDARDVLVVAPSTPEQAGVTVEYRRQPGGGRPSYVEHIETLVTVSCWSGDDGATSMKAQRDRVHALYGALSGLLRANQRVGGVWDEVSLGDAAEWFLVPSQTGVTVAVGFVVVAEALI